MTDLFNPETCMLMSAKDVQKKLDDQKPNMDFTSILNDIQSLICKHIEETPSSKLEIRLYDAYFNEKFKEAGGFFFKIWTFINASSCYFIRTTFNSYIA